MMKSILVVDDEKSVRDSIKMILEYERFAVDMAEDGVKAIKKVEENNFDLVLLDIKMPGMDGIEVLGKIRDRHPDLPVVMISGHGTIETAVEATKRGAFDFLPKPLDRNKLIITVRNGIEQSKLIIENKQMREKIEGKEQILGESSRIKEVLLLIQRVAPTDSRVLITGENGTGKELVAKAIHRLSQRRDKPLVTVNCAAIPTELIESELFGHEKGSFTGATAQRIGKFEQADGGTIFLDEVGDMSPQTQAKVLRVLEEGKIERVGGTRLISVDVRVITATNKDLLEEIKKERFREDLYHRLNVIPIHVPALRERREDIPVLANAFLEEICMRNGIAKKRIADDAMAILRSMDWGGNVRELRNIVERLVIMSTGDTIDAGQISLLAGLTTGRRGDLEEIVGASATFQEFKDHAEKLFIQKQLERYNWNITKTAEVLDIQRSHLYTKMKKYGLMREEI